MWPMISMLSLNSMYPWHSIWRDLTREEMNLPALGSTIVDVVSHCQNGYLWSWSHLEKDPHCFIFCCSMLKNQSNSDSGQACNMCVKTFFGNLAFLSSFFFSAGDAAWYQESQCHLQLSPLVDSCRFGVLILVQCQRHPWKCIQGLQLLQSSALSMNTVS